MGITAAFLRLAAALLSSAAATSVAVSAGIRDGLVFPLDSPPDPSPGGNAGVVFASAGGGRSDVVGGTVKNADSSSGLPSLVSVSPDELGPPGEYGWDFSSAAAYLSVDRSDAVGDNAAWDVLSYLGDPTSTPGVSFAAWVKLTYSKSSGLHTFTRLAGLDDVLDVSVGYAGDVGVLDFRLGPGSGGPSVKTPGTSENGVLDGNWHHVALVADFAISVDNVRLYVDGQLAAGVSFDFSAINTSMGTKAGKTLHVGARLNGGNSWLGSVADFAAFAVPLTHGEVLEAFVEGAASLLPPPPPPPSAEPESVSSVSSVSSVRDSLVFALDVPPQVGPNANRDVSGRDGATVTYNNDDVLQDSLLPVLVDAPNLPAGKAWDFGGTPAYLAVDPRHTSIITLLGDTRSTSGLTVASWIKLPFVKSLHTNARLAGVGDVFDISVSYAGDVGVLNFVLRPGLGSAATRVSTSGDAEGGVLDGNWHHVAATVDFNDDDNGDGMKLFVDGQLQSTASAGAAVDEPFNTLRSELHVGARLTGGNPWPGAASDFAVWTYALSADEVVNVHSNGAKAVRPNRPPEVSAGSSRVLLIRTGEAEASVVLMGAAHDDETPLDQLVPTLNWSVAQKNPPAASDPSFSDPSSLNPTATFSDAGEYVLRLDASDGEYDVSSTVVIFVVDESESGLDLSTFLLVSPPDPLSGHPVHPRVLFTEADKAPMLNRLHDTIAGAEYAKRLEANRILLTEGPSYFDRNADYNILRDGETELVDNVGYYGQFADVFAALVAGDMSAFDLNPSMMVEMGRAHAMAAQMFMEALRCWLYDDTAGMLRIASAVTTWAEIVSPTIRPEDDWQWDNQHGYGPQELCRIFDKVGREFLGLTYDVAYNVMTPDQRDAVRTMIVKATAGKRGYGFDEPSHLRVGNWVSFHTPPLILLALNIEGEEGYDPSIYEEGLNTLSDFYAYNLHADGEPFEPMGKGALKSGILEAFARRGDYLLAHPHLKAFAARFLLNDIQPYGYAYMGETTLGGPEMAGTHGHVTIDASLLRRAYPNDEDVALVYRHMMGESFNQYYFERTAWEILSVTDFMGSTEYGAWEWNANTVTGADRPLHYHGREKGVVVMRSEWTKDAAWLYVTSGEDKRSLGHFDHNHGAFVYSALGRNWVSYYGSEEYIDVPQAHSIVSIDGVGVAASHAKVVDVVDTNRSVFATVDQSYAYNYSWKLGENPAQEEASYNDLRYDVRPESWMDVPLKRTYSPFWGGYSFPVYEHNTVRHAFRTVGMIRASKPYAIVFDDIQKDDDTHVFEFMLRMHEDVKSSVVFDGSDAVFSDPVTDRRLLVRLLRHSGTDLVADMVDVQVKPFHPEVKRTNLRFKVRAVSPDFVVMLFAFREGESLPTTSWTSLSDGSRMLNVRLPDGRIDDIHLKDDGSGRRVATHEVVYVPPPTAEPTPFPTAPPTDSPTTEGPTSSPSASPVEPCDDNVLPADALLLHYSMDASPRLGTDAVVDLTGRTSGTLSDGTLPALLASGGDVPPEGSGAWNFASTGRHIVVAPNAHIDRIGDAASSDGLTVAFWVKLEYRKSRDTNMRIAGLSQTFDINIGYVNGNVGVIGFTFGNGNNIPKTTLRSVFPSGGSVLDGEWHHLACTVDYASSVENFVLYADGVQVATASRTVSGPFNSAGQKLRIGARSNGGNPFPGMLDSFKIYDVSLQECEVVSLAGTSYGCVPGSAELLHYCMDESPQTGSVTDSTGNTQATLSDDMVPVMSTNNKAEGSGAWNFALTGRHIAVASNAQTDGIGDTATTDGLRLSFWVKLDYVKSRDTNMRIAGLSQTFDASIGYVNGDVGVVDFTFGNGNNLPKTTLRSLLPSGGSVLDGQWHHLVCSIDYTSSEDNFVLYADGAQVATASQAVAGPFNSVGQQLRIGARLNGGNPFPGMLDSFKVYDSYLDRCMVTS